MSLLSVYRHRPARVLEVDDVPVRQEQLHPGGDAMGLCEPGKKPV